jgi:MerR family redox-sensitive transcriptional activator SoxR
MLRASDVLPIGDLARRTGLSVSAIRFYESKGLISPQRSPGGQRRFLRADIRRLSFILIVQQLGFSIREIKLALKGLPDGRTPTQSDWTALSRRMRAELDARIGTMTRLRDQLDGCIGCGCLSLKRCALYNPQDRLGVRGAGPVSLVKPDAPTEPC